MNKIKFNRTFLSASTIQIEFVPSFKGITPKDRKFAPKDRKIALIDRKFTPRDRTAV